MTIPRSQFFFSWVPIWANSTMMILRSQLLFFMGTHLKNLQQDDSWQSVFVFHWDPFEQSAP
jgi:hypothetical protein